MEAEGLEKLIRLLARFDELLAKMLDEYGDYLDTDLFVYLEVIRYEVNITLSGVVTLDKKKIPGLIKQYEDVWEEVQVFQAGLKTKGGVENEDVQADGG